MSASENVVDLAIDALGLGTQTELGARLGVSRQIVSNWKVRNRIPPNRLLQILRVIYGTRTPPTFGDPRFRALWFADLPEKDRPL